MALKSKYAAFQEGPWRLWVDKNRWNPRLWVELLRHLNADVPHIRPKTQRLYYPADTSGQPFYLKIYHDPRLWRVLKDLFRDSQAVRALKQGEALSESGFQVPLAVAAGEERGFRLIRRAFLLTVGVNGVALPYFLEHHYSGAAGPRGQLKEKIQYLQQLASETRRLHELGFVHGDLTPFNILVQSHHKGVAFFFMDNDRTRRYPEWLPQPFWKRNLIQLNRFLLPGISLQDRMRFLRFYLGRRTNRISDYNRLVHWLEAKTRGRIRQWDGTEPGVSFRRLMKWEGSFDRR